MKPPVEAPTSRQMRSFTIERELVERGRKLDAAARHVRVLGRGLDGRRSGNLFGGFAQRHAVGADQACGNRRLGAGAAFKQAAGDQQPIGALFGHRFILRVMAGLVPPARP